MQLLHLALYKYYPRVEETYHILFIFYKYSSVMENLTFLTSTSI